MLHKPILITGAARSGTSLIAGSINLSGAFGGIMFGPNESNKKGMFENMEIRQDLMKSYLRSLRVDPLGQHPLPDLTNPELRARLVRDGNEWWRRRIEGVMIRQGVPEGGQWFYKGAKMCLLWPLWHSAFPEARWIIVRRNIDDIASSCLRTGFMRAFRTAEGWKAWVYAHEGRFRDMHAAGLNIREVWPQEMIEGNLTNLEKLIKELGLTWDEQNIKDFVTPALWKEGRDG